MSVPNFALATILILVLSLSFNYSPPVGYVGFFEDPVKNLQILFLPAFVLGTGMAGAVMPDDPIVHFGNIAARFHSYCTR